MLDAGGPFKTFFRGVQSLDDDDDDERRQGHVLRKPITLPKMTFRSAEAFRVFAKIWRVGKR
jgi:hypothetical protein